MDSKWRFEPKNGNGTNIAAWLAVNKEDEKYMIQVSWPLEWSSAGEPPAKDNKANSM
jgi:hypothetical protein